MTFFVSSIFIFTEKNIDQSKAQILESIKIIHKDMVKMDDELTKKKSLS